MDSLCLDSLPEELHHALTQLIQYYGLANWLCTMQLPLGRDMSGQTGGRTGNSLGLVWA